MRNQKVHLEKIASWSLLSDKDANVLLSGRAPIRVNFENQNSALLDTSHPHAAVWAKMIDLLKNSKQPVYVEVDADTDIITTLCVPVVTRVLGILSGEEDAVYVGLTASQALHTLRPGNPDFERFYSLLKEAKKSDSELLITATMHESVIVDIRPVPPSFRTERPYEPPAPHEPVVPVSPERAIELFNIVSGKTCMPDAVNGTCIPYKYAYSGCDIRAHLMCYLMIAAKATPEKIWLSGKLTARTTNVPQCVVHWPFHVAATLLVQPPDGTPVKMVIDPSLCDGPVTVEYWKSLQGDPNAKLTPAPWQGYGFLAAGTASLMQANHDMQKYRNFLEDLWVDGKPPYKCLPEK